VLAKTIAASLTPWTRQPKRQKTLFTVPASTERMASSQRHHRDHRLCAMMPSSGHYPQQLGPFVFFFKNPRTSILGTLVVFGTTL